MLTGMVGFQCVVRSRVLIGTADLWPDRSCKVVHTMATGAAILQDDRRANQGVMDGFLPWM